MQMQTLFRYALTVIFVFLLAVLQTTVLRAVSVFGVIPNLLFSAVVCYSLIRGENPALAFGIACGLLLDFLNGRAVGMNAVLCLFTAFLCILIRDNLFRNNVFVAVLFVLGLSFAYELLLYFFQLFIWGETEILYVLLHRILPTALYTGVVTFFLYPLVRAVILFLRPQFMMSRRKF